MYDPTWSYRRWFHGKVQILDREGWLLHSEDTLSTGENVVKTRLVTRISKAINAALLLGRAREGRGEEIRHRHLVEVVAVVA
jgi:hypothetical protein